MAIKKITKWMTISFLSIPLVFSATAFSSYNVTDNHQQLMNHSSKAILMNTALNDELYNNEFSKPIYNLNVSDNLYYHSPSEYKDDISPVKDFIFEKIEKFLQKIPSSFNANNLVVNFASYNDSALQLVVEIKINQYLDQNNTTQNLSHFESVGKVIIKNFNSVPNVPTFLKNYELIDKIAYIKQQGFFDAASTNLYPFEIVNRIINNDSSLNLSIYLQAVRNLTFAGYKINDNTSYKIKLKNQSNLANEQFYKTGLYDDCSLNNAIDGNEQNKPQLIIMIEFKNIYDNQNNLIQNFVYPFNVFNAPFIKADSNDERKWEINAKDINMQNVNLNQINFDDLTIKLIYELNKATGILIPSLPLTWFDIKVEKGISYNCDDNSVIFITDMHNVIGTEKKPIYNLENVEWKITGFAPINNQNNNNTTTTFNQHALEVNASSELANSLPSDVEINNQNLLTLLSKEQIKTLFNDLPSDFATNSVVTNPIIVKEIIPNDANGSMTIKFALTYAILNGQVIYNKNGLPIFGEFVLKGLMPAKEFNSLNKSIVLTNQPNIYQFNPIEDIRLVLKKYLEEVPFTFNQLTKNKLLAFLNDKTNFYSSIKIVSKNINVADKNNPILSVKVIINQISAITGINDFSKSDGIEFIFSNFGAYHETNIQLQTTSFLNYNYDEFVKEVTKGNITINSPNNKNNLANISNIPDNLLPKISVSKMHTTGNNAKAIVTLLFNQFYGPNGLIENYHYDFMVNLKLENKTSVDTDVFVEQISISDILKAANSSENYASLTAPLAAKFFNDNNNYNTLNSLFNNQNVANLLLKNPSTNYQINLLHASQYLSSNDAIIISLSNQQKVSENIIIDGFAKINGKTTITSTLPQGVDFDNLSTQFDNLTGDALDQKAKTFLNVNNAVDGFKVKQANILTVHSDQQNNKVAYINFLISDIYVETANNVFEINQNVIYQFKYTQSNYYNGYYYGEQVAYQQFITSSKKNNTTIILIIVSISVFIILLIIFGVWKIRRYKKIINDKTKY